MPISDPGPYAATYDHFKRNYGVAVAVKCPQCGETLATLDRPCPECASDQTPSAPPEFSKTFPNRTAYRYRPQDLLDRINNWLLNQTDLISLGVIIQRDRQGLVSEVTLSCRMGWEPVPYRLQFSRLVLMSGFLGRRRTELGDALNQWADDNPGRKRLNHWVLSLAGRPVEAWLLFAERLASGVESLPRPVDQ